MYKRQIHDGVGFYNYYTRWTIVESTDRVHPLRGANTPAVSYTHLIAVDNNNSRVNFDRIVVGSKDISATITYFSSGGINKIDLS